MHRDSPSALFYQFARRPYFVLVHARIRNGHDRFDQYAPKVGGLTELLKAVLDHVTGGRPEVLQEMCRLDAIRLHASSLREHRYIAEHETEAHLPSEYRGYWLSYCPNKIQARVVVELACAAAGVPATSFSKFTAFTGGKSDA